MLKERALEGLERIYAYDIVHEDSDKASIHVEMEDGKISHLWFIDFDIVWKKFRDEKKAQSKAILGEFVTEFHRSIFR